MEMASDCKITAIQELGAVAVGGFRKKSLRGKRLSKVYISTVKGEVGSAQHSDSCQVEMVVSFRVEREVRFSFTFVDFLLKPPEIR